MTDATIVDLIGAALITATVLGALIIWSMK